MRFTGLFSLDYIENKTAVVKYHYFDLLYYNIPVRNQSAKVKQLQQKVGRLFGR